MSKRHAHARAVFEDTCISSGLPCRECEASDRRDRQLAFVADRDRHWPPMRIKRLPDYDDWIAGLRDRSAVLRITQRLARVELGHLGDHKPVGEGVLELRVHHGPGYRIYLKKHGEEMIVLLCGGDKSTQSADIRRALKLASRL